MWKCKQCGEVVDAKRAACWNCGTGRDGSAPDPAFVERQASWPVASSALFQAGSGDVQYDAAVIRRFANWLYFLAIIFTVVYTIIGIAIGAVLFSISRVAPGDSASGAFVGALLGAAIGCLMGLMKAFGLRLQAQLALCQVTIEENTRGGRPHGTSSNGVRDNLPAR